MFVWGRVAVDEAGCVYSSMDGGVGLVWPDDYSVRLDSDSLVEVLDSSGRVIVREGDHFTAGGGFNDRPLPGDCATRHPEVIGIDSQVSRVDPR
jgi:hypothetical protein